MQMLKEFLTHNWLAKLFSLALATMLWLAISGQANSEVGMNIPLEYRNIPSALEVSQTSVTPSSVVVEGPEGKMRVMEAMPTAVINIADRKTSFAGPVDLDLPDSMLRLHYLSPVDVHIDIHARNSDSHKRR